MRRVTQYSNANFFSASKKYLHLQKFDFYKICELKKKKKNYLSRSLSEWVPKWYFTSPEPRPSIGIGLNWTKSWCIGLEQMLTRVLSLPRWAIPMTAASTPCSAELSKHWTIAGTNDSHPSSPNRFSAPYFLAKKLSNVTARITFCQIYLRWSPESSHAPGTSNLCLNQSN